ncbi:MAG TPA: hypothetical protein EYP10_11020, partial [Armatimonadetes bacterium]|nr:hypothetical protein [Armatimonadota bacterium]
MDRYGDSWGLSEFAYGYANLCKRLDAEEFRGKKLVLTAWVRARKYGAHIYIDAHNAYGMAKAGIQSITAPPSNKWHRLQLIFHVPNDAVYIFPQGRIIAADGDADFDAISLRVAETGHELLPNGSFEGDELPEGWGVGKSKGVECDYEIRTDGAKVGRHYVRIRMRAPSVRAKFTTLAQYFDMVGEPKRRWHDAYRGFEHRFPYGLLAGRPQRADRLAEDTALRTERLMALTNIIATDDLDDVWRLILIGHHHDAWVCAPVIFGIWHHGFRRYAELTYAASEEARRICERMMKQITQAPSDEFALVNVTGIERDEIVHLRFVLPRGIARAPAIFIADGLTMPFACKVISRYNDGSAREIDAYVRGRIPPMGYVRATVKESPPDLLHPSIPQARLKAR